MCATIFRTLLSSELGDEPGELTVGGQATGNFYTGTLQDVRIYTELLQPRYVFDTSQATVMVSLVRTFFQSNPSFVYGFSIIISDPDLWQHILHEWSSISFPLS